MKRKTKIKIVIAVIVLLLIIIIVSCYFYIKNKNNGSDSEEGFDPKNGSFEMPSSMPDDISDSMPDSMPDGISDSDSMPDSMPDGASDLMLDSSNTKKKTTVSTEAEVESSLTENLELHATYYLAESYVTENQLVKAGENILEYTNGTYLTAPYDCIITSINIPDVDGQCTNNHYIGICSNNSLKVQISVDESKISSISIGDEATIQISAFDDKSISGTVTNISSTANNGNFTVTVEFENDGEVMLGMTSTVTI